MAYDYSKLKLTTIQDIVEIREIITRHGNFERKDYDTLWRESLNTHQPSRIQSRLIRFIKPLITMHSHLKAQAKVEMVAPKRKAQPKGEVPSIQIKKNCRASDLTIKTGVILFEGMSLKSVRINATHQSWLTGIDHEFTVVIDSRKKEFHFEPYNDLSFLLKAIQQQVNEQKESELRKKFEKFKETLPQEIEQFIKNYTSESLHRSLSQIKTNGSKLYDTMLKCGIIDESTDKMSFIESLDSCSVEIPLSDLTIFDGYIEAKLDNIRHIGQMTWENFYDWMWDGRNKIFFRRWEDEIKIIFEKHLEKILIHTNGRKSIRIMTYLDKATFTEAFIEERYQEIWIKKSGAMFARHQEYLTVPISYLTHEESDGLSLLATLPTRVIEDYLTSTRYEFPSDIIQELNELISDEDWTGLDLLIYNNISGRTDFTTREVSDFHMSRVNLRSYYRDSNDKTVLRFLESYYHDSDDFDYNYGWGQGKTPKSSISYIIIDREYGEIRICPTDYQYSTYRFCINTDQCRIECAALMLLMYFSSGISNKRQYFKIPMIFEKVGVYGFAKV